MMNGDALGAMISDAIDRVVIPGSTSTIGASVPASAKELQLKIWKAVGAAIVTYIQVNGKAVMAAHIHNVGVSVSTPPIPTGTPESIQ